ncbi:MAG TPA: c-type cytochrome, partial [candidate division Zixibacteria bacterium]|nr:c-type cytochrome [candidate division Zixibacteria bacterium]
MNRTHTTTRNRLSIVIACAALALCAAALAGAQERGKDKADEGFKNLKVLPPDIERSELIGMMRGFSGALGVRCVHCHVGDDAQGLSSFDFAADDKPAKLKARVMIEMVEAINNTHLAKLGEDNPRTVECNTCHHGLPEPTTLEEELAEVYDASGLDSALAVYQALRDEYYGGASYDFGEGALLRFAEHVTGAEDVTG